MRATLVMVIMACLWTACGSDDDSSDPAGGDSKPHARDASREVSCVDKSIAELSLFDEPNKGTLRDESKADGVFNSFIDATAGGASPTQGFVYARFAEDGLKRVDVSDEDAFSSADWDIALRRYVLRLNSGVSGPSEVTAARTRPMTEFESLTSVPDDLEYRTEEYYTASCEFVSDGSGIGAPATALASFWSYSACVAMTHNVYVIETPETRHVKLEVMSYYTPTNQQTCDETGMVPMSSNGAGSLRIRWAFLD